MNSNTNNPRDFDITTFGQPVIDHVITLRNPLRYGELLKICRTGHNGEIIFTCNSWIRTVENEEQYIFGPLVSNDKTELKLIPGVQDKVAVKCVERNVLVRPELLARLGKPIINIGGGGPNVLQILNQVFGKLSLEFIGAYSPMPGGVIDPSVRYVLEMIPESVRETSPNPQRNLILTPIYDYVPVNIVIEGLWGGERGILKSPFAEKVIDQPFEPKGKAIIVNTVYSKTLAVNALCYAIEDERLGVLALTKSLCNDEDMFNDEERDWIKDFLASRGMQINLRNIRTLYDFIVQEIIPRSPAVLIMNEEEFEHIVRRNGLKILEGTETRRFVHLDSLLKGFKVIRSMQENSQRKSKIYVTLGKHGSLCLDENDTLHYSPVTVVEGLPSKGKNAIGDTYAAIVMALEYITKFCGRNIDNAYIISSAAAAADALYYSGFDGVTTATIDEYLTKMESSYTDDREKGNYHNLGDITSLEHEIQSLPFQNAPHIRLGDLERIDWLTTINPEGQRIIGHYSLESLVGIEFLTPPYANSRFIHR